MPDQGLAQLQHGGIGRDHVNGPLFGFKLLDQLLIVMLHGHEARVDPGVLHAHGHVGGAVTRDDHLLECAREIAELFKICVPDPGNVRPVGPAVVEAEHKHELVRDILQEGEKLIEARGVFRQHNLGSALTEGKILHAPEAAFEARHGGDRGLGRDPHLCHRGDGGDGVIDVVQCREIDLRQIALAIRADDDAAAVGALLRGIRDGVIRLCAPVAAFRAAEAAEVTVGDIVVLVLRLAADAVACVGQFALFPGGNGALVNPEEARLVVQIIRQRRCQRAVGVETERDGLRQGRQRRADIRKRMRHLTVAVELIAEEVQDNHDLGLELGEDLYGRSFVTLDDGIFLFAFAEKRGVHHEFRCNAGQKIRAGAVGKIVFSLSGKALLNHAGGGSLAVGAGDGDGFHAAREDRQQIRTDPERPLTGHGGTAAMYQAGKAAQQPA